jgi:diguanylate cyclase (GGDEF)-like protein/PAS domain S-box-containing protein
MYGSRTLVAGVFAFAAGLAAAIYGMNRYDDAYDWVAHTSDVRMVIGRAVGHAGHSYSCEALEADITQFAALTLDNPLQQQRIAAVRESVAHACSGMPAPQLITQLAELDETERNLMLQRRERLAQHRLRTLVGFALSTLGAMFAVVVAMWLQRRASRTLAASEERFRMFAASSRDLIRIHEPSGRSTYVSPSVNELLGYTPEEMMSEVPIALGHPDDVQYMRDSLANIQKPGAPASTLIYRLRRKDGAYRWFETHTNPIHDAQGNLLRFYTSARDITLRKELETKLEHEATTDELTGLLNRRGFMMLAQQQQRVAARQEKGIALVFADLDGLRTINDKLGHEHGDRAIRDLAVILRATFRESDVIARLGGDEFAVVAYDIDQARLEHVLDRLRSTVALAAPIGPYPLAVSLGIAVLDPGAKRSLDDLVAEADERMYENKRARKLKAAAAAPTAAS